MWQVLATMADDNGEISSTSMERLAASAAAEPYESVRCAFACYGSYGLELADSWKCRSRMWYGVGLPSKDTPLGGGAGASRPGHLHWREMPMVNGLSSHL